jgi:site-specific DNA-methyltransferase (cytosine-N4-specific)
MNDDSIQTHQEEATKGLLARKVVSFAHNGAIARGKPGMGAGESKDWLDDDERPTYETALGRLFVADSSKMLETAWGRDLRGKVNLIFTSPPFPLNKRKSYGNKAHDKYKEWLAGFSLLFKELLAPDGSLVIELGNAWQSGEPVMSTLSIEALLELKKRGDFYLCQEFIWNNPARLPSPAQWVNIERIRVKDAFTRLWWLSPTTRPKASNRNVLQKYGKDMERLLRRGKYNHGTRPSEHRIGEKSFLTRNDGSIPSNVLTISNTANIDPYLAYCQEHNIKSHPARMPPALVEFFIKMLTDEGDLVLDPFAGSNTTGYVAEQQGRRWTSIEIIEEHARASKARFDALKANTAVPASKLESF